MIVAAIPVSRILPTLTNLKLGNEIMKSKVCNFICAASTVCLMTLVSPSANATSYIFSQSGFSGGGIITGSFDAVDLNNDGQIISFTGEVTSFSLAFTGDSVVGNFTHTFSNLYGLIYDIGSGFLGDGYNGSEEGLASNWGGASGFDYASGLGPANVLGGRVINIATGATSSSENLISVTSVPVPDAAWLLGSGLLGLIGVARRKVT